MTTTHVLMSLSDLRELQHHIGHKHRICKAIAKAFRELDDPALAKYRAAALASSRDGELEIDPSAIVSKGDDEGAYVMAWLWITDDDAGIRDGGR